jgi:indolepyruvate ferredoxin oxidoreductase
MFSKKDAHGHLIKKQYGPWIFSAMRVLARFKFLRGTVLDILGKTAERKMERALVTDYEALVKELVAGLTVQKLPLAIELASLPDSMRGYGHIKDNNVKAARIKWNALLARWREREGSETRQVA